MNYANLTKTQKRCIDAFIRLTPELANATSISRAEVEKLFFELYEARKTGGEKIGYPMWLIKGDKVERGKYVFPAPNVKHEAVVAQNQAVKSSEDEEFLAELRENGIEI